MRLLPWLLLFHSVVLSLMVKKRDADFYQVRTRINKDMSDRKGDPEDYFHKSVFHPHYDGRFADEELNYKERKVAVSKLMQSYLSTMADLGVETWLMHGTLLGWWWNKKIMPWDYINVQTTEPSMHFLAAYYNMTIHHFKSDDFPPIHSNYMLEINPHYLNRGSTDKSKVVDARWVDTDTGLFLDISCKAGHEYRDTDIFPLRQTTFEGVPAKIPIAYKQLLETEYGHDVLSNKALGGHTFDDERMEWMPVETSFVNQDSEE